MMPGRYVEFDDGTVGILADDGFVEEFDAIDLPTPELETSTVAITGPYIDIEPLTVVDSETDR